MRLVNKKYHGVDERARYTSLMCRINRTLEYKKRADKKLSIDQLQRILSIMEE